MVSVIKLEIKGKLCIEPVLPKQGKGGQVELTPTFADLHNVPRSKLKLVTRNEKTGIGFWTNTHSWAWWNFRIDRPGAFAVRAEIAAPSESVLSFGLEDEPGKEVIIEPTGSFETYEVRELGELIIPESGRFQLEFRPVKNGWNPVKLGTVMLRSVEQ